ncbi:hypothetical protein QP932_01250 [Corynebacterium freneyi]|uniref:hypothetical protein n=1 Tax=Corynebacterium freneyi TaxID=134034 RepID=UPI00254C18EA|nr:hypothetical protein [Corynebacterium freneyi]MDK8767131.1 hypothetical protein [Corynebacterium freneyi]
MKENKKPVLFGGLGIILVALVIGLFVVADPFAEELERPDVKLERPDVNGLTVSAACEKVREAGWRVDVVRGSENHREKSDCSDTERKISKVSYETYDEDDYTVILYFANEPLEDDEESPVDEAPVEEASAELGNSGYQEIYDEYSARLENECPTLSMDECAEIANEGVGKMAEYMYQASGTDGQYETYDSWARKLMGVYIGAAQYT